MKFHFSEPIWRTHLVYNANYDGSYQWCNGIYVWILFWQNTFNSIKSQKNLGGIHWWWGRFEKKINFTKKKIKFYLFFQISTVIIALGLGHFACQYSYLTCPIGKLQNVNKQLTWKCKQKVFFAEYNEALGRMTHSGCESSWNFLPQEFEVPAALATLRKIVSLPKKSIFDEKKIFFFFVVENERNGDHLSVPASYIFHVNFCLCNWTIWRIFCQWI